MVFIPKWQNSEALVDALKNIGIDTEKLGVYRVLFDMPPDGFATLTVYCHAPKEALELFKAVPPENMNVVVYNLKDSEGEYALFTDD